MKRYKPLYEAKPQVYMKRAEEMLSDGNTYSAINYVAKALKMNNIPDKYKDSIAKQEHLFLKDGNNSNPYTFLSNVKSILSGKQEDSLISIKTDKKPRQYNQGAIDKAVQKAIAGQQPSEPQEGNILNSQIENPENPEEDENKNEKQEVKESMERYKSLFSEAVKNFDKIKIGDIIVWKSIRQKDEFKVTDIKNNVLFLNNLTKGSTNQMKELNEKDFNDAKKKGIIVDIK